jgi:hypothetical protein
MACTDQVLGENGFFIFVWLVLKLNAREKTLGAGEKLEDLV